MNFFELSATQLLKAYQNNKISGNDFLLEFLENVKEINQRLKAFTVINDRINLSEKGLLPQVPVAVSDNLIVSDLTSSAGSKAYDNFSPVFEAEVVKRLKAAGAFIVGKTFVDELGLNQNGLSSSNLSLNFKDQAYSPGGPQGGAATAVAADLAAVALISDSGADIAQIAGQNSLFALAPSYGLISRDGLMSSIPSMERISFFTKESADLKLLLNVLVGFDQNDSLLRPPSDMDQALKSDFKAPFKIARFDGESLSPEKKSIYDDFFKQLKKHSYEVVDFKYPDLKLAAQAYGILACAEIYSSWMRINGVVFNPQPEKKVKSWEEMLLSTRTFGLSEKIKELVLLGALFLNEGYYEKYLLPAAKVRSRIMKENLNFFAKIDFIAWPANNMEKMLKNTELVNPWEALSQAKLAIPAALSGAPVLTVPVTDAKAANPLGLAFSAKPLDDGKLLALGADLENIGLVFPKTKLIN